MKKPALTLVELVVSIAIIAVVGTIVLVSFTLLDRRRLETAARNLMADLCWTREMAVARHQNYTVSFDRTTETYTVTDQAGNVVDPTKFPRRLRPVVIADCPTSLDNLTFQSHQGTVTLSPGGANIIRLLHTGRQRRIRIYEQTGYVRLCQEPTDNQCNTCP